MSDTNPISLDNESMKIVLTSGPSVMFTSHETGNSFDAGTKAFLVAGGKLNLRGWDGDNSASAPAETWTSLSSMAEQARPKPMLSNAPSDVAWTAERAPVDPPMRTSDPSVQCPRKVVHHDFSTSDHDHVNSTDQYLQVWSGGDGAIAHLKDGTLHLNGLDASWQGFKVDLR